MSMPNRDRYLLDSEGHPQRVPAAMSHAEWIKQSENQTHVARDECAEWCVSTVFFGMDMSDMSDTPHQGPMVYQTAAFTHLADYSKVKVWYYPTRELALQGHQAVVAALRKRRKKPTVKFDSLTTTP